jgi:hypothetical protein
MTSVGRDGLLLLGGNAALVLTRRKGKAVSLLSVLQILEDHGDRHATKISVCANHTT